MDRITSNLVGDYLVDASRPRVLVVTAQKPTGRIAVRRESKVAHVVENEQILLVARKRLHQGRHPEIVFFSAVYVPRRRVNAIGLEEGHETGGGRGRVIPAENACSAPCLHKVQEGQGNKGPCSPQEGSAFNSPSFAHRGLL